MKIERELIGSATIEEFAEQHDLTMKIHERDRATREWSPSVPRFFAYFRNAEIKDGCVLSGDCGDGNTEAEAIADYAGKISGRLLVINAASPDRREIQVPELTV